MNKENVYHKNGNLRAIISLIIGHILITLCAFPRFFKFPEDSIFVDWFDGLKNYFTLFSYVKSPIGEDGLFKYEQMNYPFGDYVYALDSTPFFAIPFRWFCHHIYDLSDYTIPIFNFFMIFNIILCGIIAYKVFQYLLKNTSLAWLLALILPWTNFQLARLIRGHYNLSMTSLCVLAILLCIWWYRSRDNGFRRWLVFGLMLLLSYFSFLIHGYYIVIIPTFMSAIMAIVGIYQLAQKTKYGWRSIISGVLLFALTGLLAFLTMKFTDGYFDFREAGARGYDWTEQKANIALLYSHYNFHNFHFPIWNAKDGNDIELMAYLGNIGLYAVLILFIISLFSTKFRKLMWTIQKDYFSDPLKAAILFAGLIHLSMAIGEKYYPLSTSTIFGLPVEGGMLFSTYEGYFILLMLALVIYFGVRFLFNKNRIDYSKISIYKSKKFRNGSIAFYVVSAVLIFLLLGSFKFNSITNLTNPLYWVHKQTEMVEQFRSLVRFAWPFYWSFYVWIGFVLASLYKHLAQPGKYLLLSLILLVGGAETADFVKEIRQTGNTENILAGEHISQYDQLSINWDEYQAILPIPFYTVGCEVDAYNYTIDDISEVSRMSFQLSIHSKLPIMASKMSRLPLKYIKPTMDLIMDKEPGPELKAALNDKPILLLEHRDYVGDPDVFIIPGDNRPFARDVYWESQKIIEEEGLSPIDSMGNVYFYRWEVRQ